ncbi:MAG: hypothetical protein MJA30_06240, partial [Cytophagales bacterium]|nr:hypothetical protein [Cytophagales bacterium]
QKLMYSIAIFARKPFIALQNLAKKYTQKLGKSMKVEGGISSNFLMGKACFLQSHSETRNSKLRTKKIEPSSVIKEWLASCTHF